MNNQRKITIQVHGTKEQEHELFLSDEELQREAEEAMQKRQQELEKEQQENNEVDN